MADGGADGGAERHYPCSQCGADLRFAPGQTHLACVHCGHEEEIPAIPEAKAARALGEIDLADGLRADLAPALVEEARVTTCPSCGAQVEFAGADHADECPWCASPVVADTAAHRQIRPQALIPFKLTEAAAADAMARWLKGLWFAPNALKHYARGGRRMQGLYSPWWTFDAATRSRYTGRRGVRRRVRRGKDTVTEVQWTRVSGRVARYFDDVGIVASASLPRAHAEGLQPWDYTELVPYAPDYLSGFRAEAYTVGLEEGHTRARAVMTERIRADVRRDIGGDEQVITTLDTDWREETFKHVLLPVWMAAYRFRGKSYRFIVNGQTGKVQGERPWSAWKIGFAILTAAVAIGGFAYLFDRM
ncbi:MAG: primosomal protein N' (replication factor Y) - superfamily II helicase [Rhodobacteraceae bacterium]|nr:primosomal protein N' (replication factor Y) - superfamily II helicase [Paracoccaceae bacterium]